MRCIYHYRGIVYIGVIHAVRQMQNVNVYKINSGVTRERRYEMVPEHQLTRLTGEQAEVMIEQLVKPIKFRCSHRSSISVR